MGSARSYLQTFTVVALLCLFLAAGGARPEVPGKVGGAAELECSFPSSEPTSVTSASLHVVEWVRRGLDIPVLIKFGSYAPRLHPQYEGRASLVRVTDLRLEDLQLQDGGLYECRILLLDEPTDELQNGTWTLLSVTAPPTFAEAPPPVMEALVGSHLSLACVAIGNPSPTITWLKDDSVIPRINYQEGALSLQAVSIQSAGAYTCHASNSEGNVTRMTKVKIKGPPVIVVPPTSTALNKSQNALLRCQAVADPPNMTYVWQRGGENVHHIESLKSRVKIMVDGTLLISSLIPEDSGNYTCMPTNGLLNPPTASANLTVMHPAQALSMAERTYLPAGMEGVVTCPAAAQPPLLRVDWTKDGEPLDLSLYPGWTLTPEGSLFMTTVNDDTAGVYTCTPYNSYGSMGPSEPTDVILQDPPSFSVAPEKQYRQEAGRTLLIPCQGNRDPTIKVTWSKVDLARRTSYSVEPNGSLLLQPLTKDHQGAWECSAANRVASVKASTQVFVLGTSPHAATSLSVSPGVRQANVSWEAGFDGGSAQTFSVWVKKTSAGDNDGRQDWFSVPVTPSSGCGLQVTGLSPATDYQFSILSQNKMGTGPFSEIAAARTLDPPPRRSKLKPPASLSAHQGSAGVVLQWSLPEAQHPPITGFVLQSRAEQGEWFHLDKDIGANSSEIVVPGLHKDCVYELRLLSRRGELLSEPSPSVNVSTVGMEIYPATSRLLELVPEPLLAGVLGGVGFMCLALVLLLGSACVISRKRDQRRRKKPHEPPSVIYKCSPSIKTSGTGSPDSVLKTSLLPASILYPTTCSTTTSSSSQTDCSSFSVESQNHRRKQLPSAYARGRLTRTTSSPIPSPIELISRGPDGRFALLPYGRDTQSVYIKESGRHDQARVQRSVSVHSERENRKQPAFVLSVDVLPCKPAEADYTKQSSGMAQGLSHHGPYISDQKASYDGFPDFSSLASSSSLATIPYQDRGVTPTFPVLPHIRSGFGQPSTTASALVLQMEHERERGNLSHCLKLAQEREELERKLQRYTLERGSMREMKREHSDLESGEVGGNELVWEYKSSTLPHRYPQGSKERFGLSPSPFSSSSVHWDVRPPLTLIPARTCFNASSTVSSSCFKSGDLHPAPSFTEQTPLLSQEEGSFSKGRLTLPHLSSKHQRHERVEAALEGYDNSPQSTVLVMQTNDSCSGARRQNNLSHGSLSTLSFHSSKYTEGSNWAAYGVPDSAKAEVAFPQPTDEDVCVEMSVDEPELEACAIRPPKPMLHDRIASHVQHGCSLTHRGHRGDASGSTSFHCSSPAPAPADDIVRVPAAPRTPGPESRRAVTHGSKLWDSKQRSQSLDSRRRKESSFLPPDAWIDSLSQENCSNASSRHPDTLFWDPQSSLTRKISKSPAGSPSATQAASQSPPAADALSLRSRAERPIAKADVPCHCEPRGEASIFPNAAKWPVDYREAMKRAEESLEAMKEASRCLPPDDYYQEALQVDAGGYEVPESGSSYSSYASSGRGSMEPANRRLSLCHLSPTLTCSPETVEEGQGSTEDKHIHQMELNQRRKASVDENYEWDATDFCSQPGDHDDLPPSLNPLKPAPCCSLPRMQRSTKAQTNCTQLSLLLGHQSSCSAEPEPDTVLF